MPGGKGNLQMSWSELPGRCSPGSTTSGSGPPLPPPASCPINRSSLLSPGGVTAFHTFLKTEFSEENLDFWLACEDFKKTRSKTKLASKANRIFEEFVQTEAPREVRAFSASVLWHQIGWERNKISWWVLLKCSQLSGKMCSCS